MHFKLLLRIWWSLPKPRTGRLVRLQQGFHIPVLQYHRTRHSGSVNRLITETSMRWIRRVVISNLCKIIDGTGAWHLCSIHKHPKPQKPKHSNNYHYWCRVVSQSVQRAVKSRRAGRVALSQWEPCVRQKGAGKLTAVSRYSGWGFGAVELYIRRNSKRS